MGGQQARQSVSSAAKDSMLEEPAASTTLQCVVTKAPGCSPDCTVPVCPAWEIFQAHIELAHPAVAKNSVTVKIQSPLAKINGTISRHVARDAAHFRPELGPPSDVRAERVAASIALGLWTAASRHSDSGILHFFEVTGNCRAGGVPAGTALDRTASAARRELHRRAGR